MMAFLRASSVVSRVVPGRLALLGALLLGGAMPGGMMLGGMMLGGCSSTPTGYYALGSRPGTPAPSLTAMALPAVIEVRTPSVTARLDRDGILKGMKASEDHMLASASWSEPLDEMIGHALTADLAQRLPGHVLFSQNESVAVVPGARLELGVTRFEEDASGHAVITGVLSAHRAGEAAETAHAVPVHWVSPRPVPGGKAAALVATLDDGIAALADQAISLLAALPPASGTRSAQP